ncbi:hypothetical protein N9D31_02820 [Oligoflexaceae bacterium]|nr:hypothetical protein [Oligoflexaceae bacterium]
MINQLIYITALLSVVSCTSTPTTESTMEEVVEAGSDAEENLSDESANLKSQVSGKIKSAAAKMYKIDLSFEKVMSAFVRATAAVPNSYSIYKYDVEYSLFGSGNRANGKVDVLSKSGDKYFTADSKNKSRTRKHFYAGVRTKKGYCGACFFEMDQVHFMLGTAYYVKPGPSSGFFSTSIRFLKGPKNKTLVVVGGGNKLQSKFKVTGVTFKKSSMEVLYSSPDGAQNKTVVKLNRTLDTECFKRAKGKKEFKLVSRYIGGKPTPYSVKK